MDSSWERELAIKFDNLKIKWIKNPTYFKYENLNGEIRKYYPDFYLPDYDCYIEVKGYWTDEVRNKISSAKIKNKFNLFCPPFVGI